MYSSEVFLFVLCVLLTESVPHWFIYCEILNGANRRDDLGKAVIHIHTVTSG